MFFLNLSLLEFVGVLGTLSSLVVALYLLDRVRNKHVVPTLRFFQTAEKPPELKHRRKLQQPWSLILQLLSLLLLLLAIAQLRLGSPDRSSRDHVLILDSSAWMAARSGQQRLIDQARAAARHYISLLPNSDRVMVVRADALATPANFFESDRNEIRRAIDRTQASAGGLKLADAIQFARDAQRLHAQRPGEIVFVGAGRIAEEDQPVSLPENLRVIPIKGPIEHTGLLKMGVRRSVTHPDAWNIFVAVKNYGTLRRSVPLALTFGGATIASRRFELNPGADQSASFEFPTRSAGWLEARVLAVDAFSEDKRAVLELPARKGLAVTIYSDEPELLRPIFQTIPGVNATFAATARYDAKTVGIVLLDRFAPPTAPSGPSIWLIPPAQKSPVRVRTTATKVKLKQWRSDSILGAGLHTKDLQIDSSEIFAPEPQDLVVAESDAGPLIVARPKSRLVVTGFHPVRSALRYELATPLLFANILRWMQPDIFRSYESVAGTVGAVNVDLESEPDPAGVRVITEDGQTLPFTIEGRKLRFFTGTPGVVRVLTGDRELVYSLTLPQPGAIVWSPLNVRAGFPARMPSEQSGRDIWQWLAILAAIALVADWILFGRMRGRIFAALAPLSRMSWRKAS
jgi:von Willebrand factor type A domain/Aerotolerance regulator N-terminal